jgi:hypothetical protein
VGSGGSCIGLLGGSRSDGEIGSWSGFFGVPVLDDMRIFSLLNLVLPAPERVDVHAPARGVTSSDHSFLFKASAVLLAASFTAAFASPVAF